MDRAFFKRAFDVHGAKAFVQLPRSEYAEVLALMLGGGSYKTDYNDGDGVCTFEIRDGDLYLRTGRGELKAVVDPDAATLGTGPGVAELSYRAVSPLGRFMLYCRSARMNTDIVMHFDTDLKNQPLLDSMVAHTVKGQRYPAFVFVARPPAGAATEAEALSVLSVPFAGVAAKYETCVALVRRRDVDVGSLIRLLRRARTDETLSLLQQPEVADARIERVAPSRPGSASAALGKGMTPRARFISYATSYGVQPAEAAAFVDALDHERRVDAAVLLKDLDGTWFALLQILMRGGKLTADVLELFDAIKQMPENMRASVRLAPCDSSVDVCAEAARLRLADPYRVHALLDDTPSVYVRDGIVGFGNNPLQLTGDAARGCAACGWSEQPASASGGGAAAAGDERKLRVCSACHLVLYCKECQVGDWKAHKKACKAARSMASSSTK